MRRTITLLLATGALAGCGGADEDGGGESAAPPATTTSAEPAPPASGDGAERVVLTDFAIDPANPKLKPGKVTFDVVNEGSAPHALEIEGAGIEEETEVLDGGGSATLEADLKAGSYEWYCPVANHADIGMKGKLTVE